MEYSVSVSVLKDDKSEEEDEVYFETEDLDDIAKINKKIIFIKEQARKQYEDTIKVYFTRLDLKKLQKEIDDINNTSGWYNDETYNEFTRQEEEFYYENL